MPLRTASRVRIVAAAVLVLMLAVAGVEAVHDVHHDVTSGVTSADCATCVALRAPLVAATPPVIGPGHRAAGEWCEPSVLRDPLRGNARAAASRGPPSRV